MTWSFDDKLPIYLQIIRILKSDLARGKYQPGRKAARCAGTGPERRGQPQHHAKSACRAGARCLLKSQRTSGRFGHRR